MSTVHLCRVQYLRILKALQVHFYEKESGWIAEVYKVEPVVFIMLYLR